MRSKEEIKRKIKEFENRISDKKSYKDREISLLRHKITILRWVVEEDEN